MNYKSPYERWQERTKDGADMAGGWVSSKYVPAKEGQYEVRDHAKYSILTWAHDHWWHLPCGDSIPYWQCQGDKRFTWKRKKYCDAAHIHWPDLLFKAVKRGSKSADEELRKLGWKGDWMP